METLAGSLTETLTEALTKTKKDRGGSSVSRRDPFCV